MSAASAPSSLGLPQHVRPVCLPCLLPFYSGCGSGKNHSQLQGRLTRHAHQKLGGSPESTATGAAAKTAATAAAAASAQQAARHCRHNRQPPSRRSDQRGPSFRSPSLWQPSCRRVRWGTRVGGAPSRPRLRGRPRRLPTCARLCWPRGCAAPTLCPTLCPAPAVAESAAARCG